jgi:oligopeptide transport system permease protein
MGRFVAYRLAQAAAALWAVVTGTFAMMHAIPGDPFESPKITPSVRAQLIDRYGLDQPLYRQYAIYLGNLAHGRLGWSMHDLHRSVGQMIRAGFPVSATLGAEALLWSVTLGILLGLLAAFRRHTPWDHLAIAAAVVGLSVPNFVIAVLGDYLLGVRVRLLPVAGWGTFAQTVLPALSLGCVSLALVARLMRARAVEVLAADYIRTARAKGLPWSRILARHVLRNALLPVVTVLGPLAAGVLTGSFVVETIFAIPGLGSDFVNSIVDRDYPLIMGVTIFYAALLIVFNLVVDVAYALVDPRIRLGGER